MSAIGIVFRSGMSSKSDLAGAVAAGVPIGVVAGNLTTGARFMTLPRHLDNGQPVFVDSGAFSEDSSDLPMDWEDILRRYDDIALMTRCPANLYVVAPDCVGNQAETLRLLATWSARIKALINQGVNVIVPIQCGALPGQQMIERVASILETRQFIAGIPSARAAMSIAECQTLSHRAFHILGRVQMNEEQRDRVKALRFRNPGATVNADANWLRSRLKKVIRLTEAERQRCLSDMPLTFDHPRTNAVAQALREDCVWGAQRP